LSLGAALQRLAAEEVEQEVHRGVRVALRKERWVLGAEGSELGLVRKRARIGGGVGDELPKVVLVHGFAQNRYTWHASRRSMSAWLALQGFDVWNLELRGHGASKARGAPERFVDYVDDAAALAEALGGPAFWIGHSLGGAVVYAVATRAPMRGVVGIGAMFRFAQANRMLNALCQLSGVLRLGQSSPVLGALNVRTRLAGRLIARLYSITDVAGYAFPISGWAPGSVEPEILAERLERGFDWTSLHVWLEMARWGVDGTFDYEEAWRRTVVPLLVIAGDLDHLMLPEDARSAYDCSPGPDRTLRVLDDYTTGVHWGHIDLLLGRHAPDHVWPLVADWMRGRP
jgi:pimeloyl-ACP methyl ester carboxylesterase